MSYQLFSDCFTKKKKRKHKIYQKEKSTKSNYRAACNTQHRVQIQFSCWSCNFSLISCLCLAEKTFNLEKNRGWAKVRLTNGGSIERRHQWQCQVPLRIKLWTGLIGHLHRVHHIFRRDFVIAIAIHKSWFTHRLDVFYALNGYLFLSNCFLAAINPNFRLWRSPRATMLYFWWVQPASRALNDKQRVRRELFIDFPFQAAFLLLFFFRFDPSTLQVSFLFQAIFVLQTFTLPGRDPWDNKLSFRPMLNSAPV